MSNDYLFDLFTIHIVRGTGCITFVLNLLACYVILQHSPRIMRSYRRVLLGITLTAAAVDSVITLLVVPVPLEGALGNELIGPLATVVSERGNLLSMFLLWSLTSLLWSIEVGFAYRLYIVNTSMNESSAGPFINALLFGHPLILIIFLSIMYTRAFSSEEEKQRYASEHALNVSPDSALMLILPHKYPEHTEFSMSCLLYGIIVFIAIALIIRRIRRVLTTNSSHISAASLRMHKMLLRSLIWQSVIPFFFIFIPIVLLILSVTSQNIFIEGAETPYYARLFPAIALCILSLYSITHVIVMIAFTKPYQSFVFGFICRRRSTTTLSKDPISSMSNQNRKGTSVCHQ